MFKCHVCDLVREGETFQSTETIGRYSINGKYNCQTQMTVYLQNMCNAVGAAGSLTLTSGYSGDGTGVPLGGEDAD